MENMSNKECDKFHSYEELCNKNIGKTFLSFETIQLYYIHTLINEELYSALSSVFINW